MNTQPTPRTDANVKRHNLCRLSGNDLVYADFPRQLERELAAVTEQRDRLAEALQKVVTSWDHAEWLDENDFESFRATLQSLTPKKTLS
jgi:hypothetical protein